MIWPDRHGCLQLSLVGGHGRGAQTSYAALGCTDESEEAGAAMSPAELDRRMDPATLSYVIMPARRSACFRVVFFFSQTNRIVRSMQSLALREIVGDMEWPSGANAPVAVAISARPPAIRFAAAGQGSLEVEVSAADAAGAGGDVGGGGGGGGLISNFQCRAVVVRTGWGWKGECWGRRMGQSAFWYANHQRPAPAR